MSTDGWFPPDAGQAGAEAEQWAEAVLVSRDGDAQLPREREAEAGR
jgi:hypothetical protein